MKYRRHYVQFNDLVFDEYDMIAESEASTSFKDFGATYTFKHGDYVPYKDRAMLAGAGSVSFTLILRMKKLACDDRPFYRRFVIEQLTKPGKLWAVQDNTLVWAYAHIANYTETGTPDRLEIDVSFAIPEGVWHKADLMRTFLQDFDICNFMDCYQYNTLQPCDDNAVITENCNCCCDDVTAEMALCYHTNELQRFYDCTNPWKIIVDCRAAEEIFGDTGQRFCGDDFISGRIYSDTELPADATIRLVGQFRNPRIEINGNANIIKGDYDGVLTVYPDGSVEYLDACGCPVILDASVWQIPKGNTYSWKINPGFNAIVVDKNNCDSTGCVYVDVDALTI